MIKKPINKTILKQALIILFFASLFGACVSNKNLTHNYDLKGVEQLKSDVDFAYKKLQKLHPRLYWYISKEDLDYKFDSLKSSLTAPMTSGDFYFKLSPVISSIKQGHTRLQPKIERVSFKDIFTQAENRGASLYQFDYEMFDDKLYVVKNVSGDMNIKPGTEVVSVNHFKPDDFISKYRNTFASDGYNRTYTDRRLSKGFPDFFYMNYDITDSVFCQLKYNDTIQTICLKEKVTSAPIKDSITTGQGAIEGGAKNKSGKTKKGRGHGFFDATNSKDLIFSNSDSTTAILKIENFYDGIYNRFYSNVFRQLDSLKTENLIIDLRDNPGGELGETRCLFSHLVDTSFIFIDKSEVTSETSILHAKYFKGNPLVAKVFLALLYPFELLSRGMLASMVQKGDDNRYYIPFPESLSSSSKPNSFKGKVYVLINGGTFSASCLLASNLKGSKRAFFVGEETGGAANGTVAGKIAAFILPKS